MYKDSFGYIPQAIDFDWKHGAIRTDTSIETAKSWITEQPAFNGFISPDYMFKCPATHHLELDTDSSREQKEIRQSDAGFLIHFLAFMYGRRAQFHDWWMDNRLQVKEDSGHHIFESNVPGYLEHAFDTWFDWDPMVQRTFTNAIYMHGRASGYFLHWEKFQAEYQVSEALYKAYSLSSGNKCSGGHSQRLLFLCDELNLCRKESELKEIVKSRNELIHEALWNSRSPGTNPGDVIDLPYRLHRFNRRLIYAILGFKGNYVSSNWLSGGCMQLDLQT